MPREFDSKRRRSNYDRDPSPRRSRRDGKPATERNHGKTRTEDGEIDEVRKQRRVQDPLPLGTQQDKNSKLETSNGDKEHERRSSRSVDGTQPDLKSKLVASTEDKRHERRSNRNGDGTKQSDPVFQSRSYLQHDDRGTQDGRTSWHRVTSEGRWQKDDSKNGKIHINSAVSNNVERGDKKPAAREEDIKVWRHDRFLETETEPNPSAKKRRPFREEKLPLEPETLPKLETAERFEPNRSVRSETEVGRIEEKGNRFSRFSRSGSDRYHERDRTHVRDRRMDDKGYRVNGGFVPRDRYGGRRFGADRERFGQRPENRAVFGGGGGNVEKWKHDLFDQEADDTTTNQKKEEDPVAKVEALLAL